MTPEEARAIEPGTTPGPWMLNPHGIILQGDDMSGPVTEAVGHMYRRDPDEIANGELMAAAPDMRTTIAAQTWEYRVEVFAPSIGEWVDPWNLWSPEEEARKKYADLTSDDRAGDYRLVRRPVGPVEVVE